MYARYIPPAKGPRASKTSGPPTASAQAPAPSPPPASTPATTPQAVGGAGFSYSRYIPGSKPAVKPAATSSVQYFDDEPSPPSSKRKRDVEDEPQQSPQPDAKKSKKSKHPDAVNGVDHSEQPTAGEAKKSKDKKEKKAKKSRRDATSSDLGKSKPKDVPDEPGEERKSKSKKERKEKKEKKQKATEEYQNHDREGNHQGDADVSMTDADGPQGISPEQAVSEHVAKKEKRKDKDKAKKEDAADEEGSAEEKEKRHKLVLERKAKSLKLAGKAALDAPDAEPEADPQEVHDLEPLPQPQLVSVKTPNPTYETLPSWLAAPIRVSQDTRTPFSELGLLPKAARVLEEKGFSDAFAVQTAAIPLLLPTSKQRPGDLLISAATGSGKTLAYALPIVRDISQGLITRLRALVVLPTRELVKQAQEVFELCARAYEGGDRKRVRVGVAIGSQTLRSEQEGLIERESRYDPEAYQRILDQRRSQHPKTPGSSADIDSLLGPSFQESDPRLGEWDGQVNDFPSKVDVLICTPGRLVEHIEQTPGFDLDYVRWLVVDEADKLLAQSFQGWLDVVLEKFQTRKFTAREFPDMDLEGVRKIVLSATLTRDLGLLNQLGLRRPQLIVLESDGEAQVDEHALPALLEEFAVRVHNTNLKPLYLLDLLKAGHMKAAGSESQPLTSAKEGASSASDTSDSSSDSSSDSNLTSDSDSDSDSESGSDKRTPPKSTIPISLIFTKSNESALRLSRLLTLLDESLSAHISTLTSTTPTHLRRKTLRAFTTPSSPIRLIVASDLVARGIDLPNLDHVINYDLPPSVAGYVHRVGRTARAGRSGRAWTLVGDDESGWFWGKIAKGAGIRRPRKVGRVRIEEMGEERVQEYEEALGKLGQEALDTRKR